MHLSAVGFSLATRCFKGNSNSSPSACWLGLAAHPQQPWISRARMRRPPPPPRSLPATTTTIGGRLLRSMGRGATAALAVVAAATAAASTAAAASASSSATYSGGAGAAFVPIHHQQQQRQQRQWGDRGGGAAGNHQRPLLLFPSAWALPPFRIGGLHQPPPFSFVGGALGVHVQRRGLMTRRASGGGEGRRWRRDGALLVTSAENGKVKRMKALGKKKKERERENLVLLEGHRLLLDAVEAGHIPDQVLVCPEAFDAPRGQQLQSLLETLPAAAVTLCAANLVAAACDTVSPQGVVAVIPRPSPSSSLSSSSSAATPTNPPLCLVMDGMQDPGNVGTLIRTAVACGVSEVMVVQGCDPWSPKALRSAMGATFKAPRVSEAQDWAEAKATLEARHGAKGGKALQFVAADGGEGVPDYDAIDWTAPSVLVVGNEGSGLSGAVRAELKAGGVRGGRIPLAGGIESLNAGAAGAIILAEAARQRRR